MLSVPRVCSTSLSLSSWAMLWAVRVSRFRKTAVVRFWTVPQKVSELRSFSD